MKILVIGSAGHLGEALLRTLKNTEHEGIGVDIQPSPYTDAVGSITDPDFARHWVAQCDSVIHTATLHKPHIGTHTRH